MSKETRTQIEEFISELTAFSSADVLVHVDEKHRGVYHLETSFFSPGDNVGPFSIPLGSNINQVLKVALNYQKTADIHSLCLAQTLFCWSYKEKQLQTPFFLFPLKAKINKIKQEAQFQLKDSDFHINPFILNTLKREFDIDLSASLTDDLSKESILQVLIDLDFSYEIKPFLAIGNFHYHRFEIIKDLEEIQTSETINPLVKQLLGEDIPLVEELFALSPKLCFDSDTDQEAIFEKVQHSNCVVQGPPGTGKTQFLSNLLCKLLAEDSSHLLVSEKRTALQILEQKLKTKHLDSFVFLADSNAKSSDFIKKLKKSWQFIEKQNNDAKPKNLLLSKQLKQQIQLSFDKINSYPLFQHYSLAYFQEFEKQKEFSKLPYISSLPEIKNWMLHKEFVSKIYAEIPPVHLLSCLKASYFKYHQDVDLLVRSLSEKFNKITEIFSLSSLKEIDELLKIYARIQLLDNENGKKYIDLLQSAPKQKKFTALKKKFEQKQLALDLLANEEKNWKNSISLSELQSWKFKLQNLKGLRKVIVLRQFKKLLVKPLEAEFVIENYEKYLLLKDDQLKIVSELSELGIENPSYELSTVSYLIHQLQQIEANELNQIVNLDENLRKNILDYHFLLHQLKREITDAFQLDEEESIQGFLVEFVSCSEKISVLLPQILELPTSILANFKNAATFQDLEKMILKANWLSFKTTFPELAAFSGNVLADKINKIHRELIDEQNDFSTELIQKRVKIFANYQSLLLHSSTKLKEEEKSLKKQLKSGKAILVKEFSKSKQHKSIRELMNSEALPWIKLLCPIFLATPGMVSKHFSLENQFEFVLFDEASQITLPRSLSAIQRAKRIIVAGDEQQMSPSQLFSGIKSSVDLLHQSRYYFSSISLKHHYRSQHSELISFSNKHFYQNELIVYPAANKPDTITELHVVSQGVYENRMNLHEAKEVAKFVSQQLHEKRTLGIVAFSEQQLACIWSQFSVNDRLKIEQRLEENTIFFKALEQVQGEECDQLIISFAYGKNKDGVFHKRFGPLSFSSGSKRLNVLFTRAIQKIDLFCSVSSSDFELSNNEAINLFRLYLIDLENKQKDKNIVFPFALNPIIDGKNLKIEQIHKAFPTIDELLTFHQVMESRAWKISYQL